MGGDLVSERRTSGKDVRMTSLQAAVAAADPSLITVGGLPLHPLAVHVAVVLLPLSALALILLILRPALRAQYLWLALTGLVAGVGATIVAVQAGEQLALITGISEEHRRYGKLLQADAIALLAVAAWWSWQQGVLRGGRSQPAGASALGKGPEAVSAVGTIALSLAAVVLTTLVGHSGATAVWGGRINAPMPSAAATASTTAFTTADLRKHATTASCWSAIDGKVYDLTNWINKHPGGSGVIKAICGIDGSAAFDGQHSGQSRPAGYLAGYEIGNLKSTGSSTSTTGGVVNSLTMAGVQSHNTATNCWTIVNGNVYNVTSWIERHPGGAGVIQGLCGIDGSAAFAGQHGNQDEPNQILESFKLGALKN